MLNKRELNKIKKALPKDGYALISAKTGMSTETVRKYLNDTKRYNQKVIDTAFEVISDFEREITIQKTKTKTL